jgi:hypothetical protein
MFLYHPPRMLLRSPEQELLLAALVGGTDEALATRLGISLSGVKARWSRIHAKAAKQIAELLPARKREGAARGGQIKHIILRYVRDNPSELTPYRIRIPNR